MGDIEKAIEEFKRKQLDVYRADPQRIVRDTRGAERAAKDHAGRWLFELLQNSEDACAPEVKIIVTGDTIYVADNGKGFKPEAVCSICGTDFSDKTSGTIGRKGIGFKSVYEVSSHPQLLTVSGEGVEFSPERASEWLRQNSFDDRHVPYQWIPFLIPWDVARRQDPVLEELKDYKTVIRLSGLSEERRQIVEQLLKEWPPHALFPFRNVRTIKAPNMEVVLAPGAGVWQIDDSRKQIPQFWFVVNPEPEYPPDKLMGTLGEEERNAIQMDGVSFLIAAPHIEDRITPTEDYLPIHVFYPTDQKGPVRLLLHAEFLVKSDRTVLIPIEKGSLNEWVTDRLAHHVCGFVNNAFRSKNPSGHAALLVPFDDRGSHPVAEKIWKLISDKAKADLRLADVEGNQRLSVGKANLISVSIRPELARTLLESTKLWGQLLHREFDDDKEARKALKELGCKEIHDQDLMDILAENADSRSDTEWIWSCWEWLADWVAQEPYGDKHKERVARVRLLPIVPVDGRLCKPADLETHIVTWKPEGHVENLPNWLPLTFVGDWFRDKIQSMTEKDDSVMKLCAELAIKEPGADVIQRAIGRAIVQYWKDKQDDPGRFLSFIMEQDWHETSEVSRELKRCPVPLSQPVQDEGWAEAGKAYFGREWGNNLLAALYDGIESVAWVRNENGEDRQEKRRRVMEWLGVAASPRVVVVKKPDAMNVWDLPTDCNDWKKYLDTAHDTCGRWVRRISHISKIAHLAIDGLNSEQAVFLVRLIAKHWDYYGKEAETTAQGTQGREQYYRSWEVKAKWWWEVCELLPLPRRDGGAERIGLMALWLLDKRTERAMGDLLPVIDLDAFGDDKDDVRKWLENVVHLRTRIAQVTVEEWKELLSTRIPDVAPAERLTSNERLRDKVTGWYTACLEAVAEDENELQEAFAQCPLLCQKGNEWKYVGNGEPRYLDDDNDFAKAFAEDIWLFHVPSRLAADTLKFFSVNSLSEFVKVDVTPGDPKASLSDGLLARFNESLLYVCAWRSSQNKQDAETLSARLKRLRVYVVPSLKANLSLDGVCHEVEQHWHVTDGTIYVHGDHTNEADLALALAKVVGVSSEADFYENLLRCYNDNQRKEKLLSKGIAEAEVERGLREYSGHADDVELEGRSKEKKPDIEAHTPPQPSQPENKAQQQKSAADKPQDTKAEKSQEQAVVGDQPLHLKDSLTVDYVIGEPPQREFEAGGGGGGGGGGGSQEGRQLTEEEKILLEGAGRELAARELEKMGYAVKRMPSKNPGFDLLAIRIGEELRVEVKAHTGRATVVDVTQREYKEYLGQQRYRWELWNVEHLSENDTEPVTITRYNDIPDAALDVRTFRVDLKKCQVPSNPSSAAE